MRDNAALIERVREGDKQAEKLMVEQNMGLVHSIVGRFLNRGCEKDDLTQIGAMGLIKAVKKFNPDFNVQFSTYAVPMIIGEIRRFLRDDGALKISRTFKENALKGRRSEEALLRKLNRQPTIAEISADCGIEVSDLLEAYEAVTPPESLYGSVYDNGEKEIFLLDTLSGNEIEDGIVNRVMLNEVLMRLSEREKEVILMRYFRCKTQSEIANHIGVSQVQVSRIEKKAIERIRNEVREND